MPGISQKYPPENFESIFPNIPANEPLLGFTHSPNGDLTVATAFSGGRHAGRLVWEALGLLDLMDQQQSAAHQEQRVVQQRQAAQLESMNAQLKDVRSNIDALRAHINEIINYLPVSIPAWTNKEEVENGDDMGMVSASALSLGLIVEFEFLREEEGFDHEEVVYIIPPAGSLVNRRSVVKVGLNLKG